MPLDPELSNSSDLTPKVGLEGPKRLVTKSESSRLMSNPEVFLLDSDME